MKNKFIFFIFTLGLNFALFGKLLSYSLSGDDYLTLYRFVTSYDGLITYFDVRRYTGNYDIANIIMGIVYSLFGINPKPYFLLAIILRTIAALSFFPLLHNLTKNRLIAFLGVIMFSVSYAGIQSMDWAFNMTSYLSIAFFNYFLVIWLSERKKKKSKIILLLLLTFLSFVITPNRMHAIIFVIILLEIIRFFSTHKRSVKILLYRLIIFLTPILLFRRLTASNWDQTYTKMAKTLFEYADIKIILNPIINLSSVIFPSELIFEILKEFKPETASPVLPTEYLIAIAIWIFYLLFLFFIIKRYKYENPKLVLATILLFLAAHLFELVFFLVYPHSIFPSADRYHVVSSALFALSLLTGLSLIASERPKITFAIILLYIISNTYSVSHYLDFLFENGRNFKEVEAIFSDISQNAPPNTDKLSIYLFESENSTYLYHSTGFGFGPHMAFLFPQLFVNKNYIPLGIESPSTLKNILYENRIELIRYGYPIDTEIGNIYKIKINKSSAVISDEVINYN